MKKIFCIIVLFISVVFSGAAQMKSTYFMGGYELYAQIGEYKSDTHSRNKSYSRLPLDCEFKVEDAEEGWTLEEFINSNKDVIREKLGIVIMSDAKYHYDKVTVVLMDAKYYEEYMRFEVADKRVPKSSKENRISSLGKI